MNMKQTGKPHSASVTGLEEVFRSSVKVAILHCENTPLLKVKSCKEVTKEKKQLKTI